MKDFTKVIIPNFIFEDGRRDIFIGYDRGCCPVGDVPPKYIEEFGLFNEAGMYYAISVDNRKSKRQKDVTLIYDGNEFFHPIVSFRTIGATINPENGHMVDSKDMARLDAIQNNPKTRVKLAEENYSFCILAEDHPWISQYEWYFGDNDGRICTIAQAPEAELVYLSELIILKHQHNKDPLLVMPPLKGIASRLDQIRSSGGTV